MNYKLREINIYPVKSLAGISLQSAEATDRGLKYDRRWMVVDKQGRFLTQRTYPQMALVRTSIDENKLTLSHRFNYFNPITVPINHGNEEQLSVIVWNDTVYAEAVDKKADEWLSNALNLDCRLVYMPEDTKRPVDKKYWSKDGVVSFADAYPFLIIGEESLNDLNSRLAEKIPMNRFRPNFVFSGGEPFDEDRWKKFRIGSMIFYAVKPCSRCVVTTVNQETAEKKDEPLRTLASYRTVGNNVNFGQNLVHEKPGIIHLGDLLEVLEWK